MKQLVVACSLSATSRSAKRAEHLADAVRRLEVDVELVDLRTMALPESATPMRMSWSEER